MSKRYVYILVEVARRELDSRLALGVELIKRGMVVIVGEKNEILWNIMVGKYPPGVILDKCAQYATKREFLHIIKKGFIYTVLDEEGLITSKEYFNKNRFSKKAEKYVAANFVTGKYLNDLIFDEYPDAKNVESGNPRYSMIHPKWDYWFQDEFEIIKKTYGRYVLIVSSFNPYPEAYKNAYPGMSLVDEKYKYELNIFLAKQSSSGFKFVLRPHPSDQPNIINNISVDDRFNIIPWIKSAEYIINAKCTTSLECFLANKSAYTWKGIAKEKVYKLPDFFANDLSELDKKTSISEQAKRLRVMKNILFNHDDPYSSFNIIADKLEQLSFESSGSIKSFNIQKLFHFKNRLRSYLWQKNYDSILLKFTNEHVLYAVDKLNKNNINYTFNSKTFILKT
jgi:surface carbohydrate biosynthesis protein